MKKIYSLLITLLLCVTASGQTTVVTQEMAYGWAKNIVGDGDYDYYIGETILPSSDVWWTTPGQQRIKCWLVFVDLEPQSGWEHPCKYIYVYKTYNPTSPKHPYTTIDSVCPPANVSLKPIDKVNRYGAKATMKPFVPKIQANDINTASGHTYAIILNGGGNKTANKELYWNDCSFIYKTLINRYEVPKNNIKIIMSDGTSDGADMNPLIGDYVSSPLDLDDDGKPDIEYSATKSNLQAVLNGLAQKLTDADHLLLFVTDHGGYDRATKKQFLYLWDEVKLYPEELASYLEPVNAGFMTIVMGQCYSGGFINSLKKNNRVIITASKEDERSLASADIPFNEFLYHWTSAINGYDAYGNRINVKRNISVLEAQAYAANNDCFANGSARYGTETPQVNFYTNSVVSDLSFDYIPPQVELCFENSNTVVESRLETRKYGADSYTPPPVTIGGNNVFFQDCLWNSPCIWMRNNGDGMENQKTEPITIEGRDNALVYIYIKVRNRGVKPYTTKDKKLKTYWTKSSMFIIKEHWKGIAGADGDVIGGDFSDIDIIQDIESGKSIVLYTMFIFHENNFKILKEGNGCLCLLAFIKEKDDSGDFPVDSDRIAVVWRTNKLAQSNVMFLKYTPLNIEDYSPVNVRNWTSGLKKFSLRLVPNENTTPLFSEARISVKMSPELLSSWNTGGKVLKNIEQDKNDQNIFLLKSNNSQFKSINMNPGAVGSIGLKCNFIANNGISVPKEYEVDVALIDDETGKCYGGETFRIVQGARNPIRPVIRTSVTGQRTVLTASNVSENVTYKWYDSNGILVGTGPTFTVPTGRPVAGYRVQAEAVSDGAIGYTDLVSSGYSSIKSVDSKSNPGVVTVDLTCPASDGAVLRITPTSGNISTTDYRMASGTTTYDIPASDLSSGVYQVSLIEGGTVTGAVKFTK